MLNINFTTVNELKLILDELDTRGLLDAMLVNGTSARSSVKVVSNAITEANRAILAQRGLQRTPKVREAELPLRVAYESANGPIDWNNLQVRIDALLSVGYDIFTGGKVALPDSQPPVTLDGIDDAVLDELDPEDLG